MFRRHPYIPVLLLFIAAFAFRLAMICIDPYLHHWDEHFHALVAKNMIDHPLKPMLLVHPVVPYHISSWTSNHVWVHKQPLFLWQMALSIKMFGYTEIAVRIPSVVMTSLSVLLVYRITFLMTKNYRGALFAGILICCSSYQFQLISGRYPTDHNDVAFGFYVLASIWAYVEYLRTVSWKWVVLIGVFAGCAILNKWLTGLLVYSAWGIKACTDYYAHKDRNNIVRMSISLLICFTVFLPWQLYIYHAFPAEWAWENEFNNRHLWEAMEANAGSIFFYLGRYNRYYGLLTILLFAYGIYVFATRHTMDKNIGYALLAFYSVVFVFFSVVVQTKMTAFVYCVLPIGFVFAGVGLEELYQRLTKKWIFFIAFGLVILNTAHPVEIWLDPLKSSSRSSKIFNAAILKKADQLIPQGIEVVMNLSNNEHVDLMFYSKRNFTAYGGVIREEYLRVLASKKIPIAAFMNHGKYVLPAYVEAYPYLYIIPVALKDLP